jgi:hypothetical protein
MRGICPASNGQEDFECPLLLFQDIELLKEAVEVAPRIIPTVSARVASVYDRVGKKPARVNSESNRSTSGLTPRRSLLYPRKRKEHG